jgi:hypothetical protein
MFCDAVCSACRLQLPAACLPTQPGMLYVVLYSGQLLQDAVPLLVVPPAVAQELQALFAHMQQQHQLQQEQQQQHQLQQEGVDAALVTEDEQPTLDEHVSYYSLAVT